MAGTDTISVPNPKKPDELVPYGEQPFRYEVELMLTDGEWLVDNFGEVGTLDGVAARGRPDRAPAPTDGGASPSGGDRE